MPEASPDVSTKQLGVSISSFLIVSLNIDVYSSNETETIVTG